MEKQFVGIYCCGHTREDDLYDLTHYASSYVAWAHPTVTSWAGTGKCGKE